MFKKITPEQIEEYGFNSICNLGEAYFSKYIENFYIYSKNYFVVENEEGFLIYIKKSEKPELFYIRKENRKTEMATSVYQNDMLNFVASFSERFDEVTVTKTEGRYCIFAITKIVTTGKMILEFIIEQMTN